MSAVSRVYFCFIRNPLSVNRHPLTVIRYPLSVIRLSVNSNQFPLSVIGY
jgi:hypothetical protein